MLNDLLFRLRALFRREAMEAEMDEEFRRRDPGRDRWGRPHLRAAEPLALTRSWAHRRHRPKASAVGPLPAVTGSE